jgi:hypothetical protein
MDEVLEFCRSTCRIYPKDSPAYGIADHIIYMLTGDHPGCLYDGGHPKEEAA